MKTLLRIFFLLALMISIVGVTYGQTTRKERQAAEAAKLKNMIENDNYVFTANYALPLRGGSRQLDYGYDVSVSKDSIISYLPYFGRAYLAPTDPLNGGIKFTSTRFDYQKKVAKNGSYDITITPKERDTDPSKDVRYLRLNVSINGYASLQVISSNRDAISFNGIVEGRKPKGK